MTLAVVIPVFNGERYLAEAVASVRSQSVRPDEIVVVDDGSTDGTAAWLSAQDDLTILTQENRGAGAARNRGVQNVTASILAFLDADDMWRPDYIEHQRALLDADASVDAVFALGRVGPPSRRQLSTRNTKTRPLGTLTSMFSPRCQTFLLLGCPKHTPEG